MIYFSNYAIVMELIPDLITLAFNLTHCPHRCAGCHSPLLRNYDGTPLDIEIVDNILQMYGNEVTCVCFMGGDNDSKLRDRLASQIKSMYGGTYKTAVYSGDDDLRRIDVDRWDYIKIGSYMEDRGPLNSPLTNQVMYKKLNGSLKDITDRFRH